MRKERDVPTMFGFARQSVPQEFNPIYKAFRNARVVTGCTWRTIDTYDQTLGEFLEWCLEEGVSPRTISNVDLRAFLAYLKQRNLAPYTVHKYARSLKAFFNFAQKEGMLLQELEMPIPRRPKKPPKYLKTQQEIDAVMGACLTDRDRAIVRLLLDSGLRRMEITALNWGDLQWNNERQVGRVVVRNGKGQKQRRSYFTAKSWHWLKLYRDSLDEERKTPTAPVFQTRRGERLQDSGYAELFKRLSWRSGVHVSPHMMRHTYGRKAAMVMPLPALQKTMGHSSITTTMIYAELADDSVEEAYASGMNGNGSIANGSGS